MKILILNWRDPKHPFAGGAEKSVLEHAKYWKRKGAEVTWFAASFSGSKNEDEIDGIKIIREGNHYTVHVKYAIKCILHRFKKYDIVVDCFHFSPFFSPLFMPKTKKIALIQETAGRLWFKNIIFPLALIGYLSEPLFFKFYRNVDFITASRSAIQSIMKMGIRKERIHLVYHGVDRMKVEFTKEKDPTILYLGLLTKDKGFEDACVAAKLVKKEIPNLNFWIAGKESKEGDYNWYIGQAKNFAKYFGFVDETKKFELFRRAWVLVHPSEKEGWGLTVIEAATQSTPTVGYDVPGLQDSIVDGQTGILNERNPKQLARSIVDLIRNPEILSEISNRAKKRSDNFTWEKAGRESWKLIGRL